MTIAARPQVAFGNNWQWPALIVGVLAAIACAVAAATGSAFFYRAYLYGYLFWLGVALGGMALAMVHHLTGGGWGRPLRYIAEAAAMTLPVLALGFLPVLLGLHVLYPWARPEELAREELLRHRELYLNPTFFTLRAAAYFVIWSVLALLLVRWSRQVDAGDEAARWRVKALSGAGLVIYSFTMLHASIDWLVSRDIHYYTTAIGFVVTTGQTLVAMAFGILVVALLIRRGRQDLLPSTLEPAQVFNDLGNLLLVLVILWTYVTFFQFLVVWMGNSREDNGWFVQRGIGSTLDWRWIGLAIVLAHFFVPFFLLLFRASKRHLAALTTLAALIFVAHFVEQYWLVAPSGSGPTGLPIDLAWIDFVTPVAVGGIWLAVFFFAFTRRMTHVSDSLERSPGG